MNEVKVCLTPVETALLERIEHTGDTQGLAHLVNSIVAAHLNQDREQRIFDLVERHRWNGGYDCACGAPMNSPQTWSRHVLEDAL